MFRIAKAKFSGAADSKTDEFEEVQETENEFGQSLRTRDNEDRDTKRSAVLSCIILILFFASR